MTSPRASLLASGLLHAVAIGSVGWFAASAAGRGTAVAEIRIQVEDAPDVLEPSAASDVQVNVEATQGGPDLAEARVPDEWLDPRTFEPAPRRTEPPLPVVDPSPAAWFASVRPAPATPADTPAAAPSMATPAALVVEVVPGENPPPEYPWLARRRGFEGVVAIRVTVDVVGAVIAADVARSSRHGILDAAALRAVRGWHFRHGPGETVVEVEFALRAR